MSQRPEFEDSWAKARDAVAFTNLPDVDAQNPYGKLHLPERISKYLSKPLSLGPLASRVGDLVPIVNEIPPNQSRFDIASRPRDTWESWATLPAEIMSLISPSSFKPKSRTATSPRRIILSPETAPESSLPALQDAKRLAQRLPLSQRANNADIFQQTGWWLDPVDKKWRFEVPEGPGTTLMAPEAQAKFNDLEAPPAPRFDMSLSDVDELIEAKKDPKPYIDSAAKYEAVWHPSFDLPEIDQPRIDSPSRVYFEKTPISYSGKAPYSGVFYPPEYGTATIIKVKAGDLATADDVLRHEFQHDISAQSGLPRGGSPNSITPEQIDAYLTKASKRVEQLGYEIDALVKNRNKISNEEFIDSLLRLTDEHNTLNKQIGVSPASLSLPAYKAIKGEVDARNVQKRWDMTPEERKIIPPWMTEDVHPFLQWLNILPGEVAR